MVINVTLYYAVGGFNQTSPKGLFVSKLLSGCKNKQDQTCNPKIAGRNDLEGRLQNFLVSPAKQDRGRWGGGCQGFLEDCEVDVDLKKLCDLNLALANGSK